MLFTGHSEHTIDAKQRLAIPAKHRFWGDGVGPAWFCMPLPHGPLRLYPESVFKILADQGGDSLTPEESVAEFESTFYAYTEKLELDSAHRIVLPKSHLQRAGIGSDIVLVGARKRLEVWDKAKWFASDEERFNRLPSLMARVEDRKRSQGGP